MKTTMVSLFSALILTTHVYAAPYAHPIPDKDVLLSFGTASKRSLPQRMNILVWNLHKGSNDTFPTDFVELAHEKDLVVAQEMQLDNPMKTVFKAFPLNYYATATSFYIGSELYRTGVATSGPVLPTDTRYVRTQTLEPVLNSPKVTLITRYPLNSSTKELTIVNIHGINFVDGISYKKEIDRIYEQIKDVPGPLIFTGDFNSWSDDRDASLNEMTKKLKLHEANFIPDNRIRFNKHPLDHFFYTDDIKIIEAKVDGFYQGSDHKPLELVIEYSPLLK
ncbi:MAG: endonuclease/exonuclease/phosphatase family protein [Bacteriovorax sp.]